MGKCTDLPTGTIKSESSAQKSWARSKGITLLLQSAYRQLVSGTKGSEEPNRLKRGRKEFPSTRNELREGASKDDEYVSEPNGSVKKWQSRRKKRSLPNQRKGLRGLYRRNCSKEENRSPVRRKGSD